MPKRSYRKPMRKPMRKMRRRVGRRIRGITDPNVNIDLTRIAAAAAGQAIMNNIAGSRTKTVTVPRPKQGYVDSSTQISNQSLRTGRKKRVTLQYVNKQLQAKNETTIYRWNGMKSFDDNGYYWIGKHFNVPGNVVNLPLYMYDLTGIINQTPSGVQNAICLKRLQAVTPTGALQWSNALHLLSDGASTSSGIALEKAPTGVVSKDYPHEKSMLRWTDVRMNLWGARNRAVKYVIQIVKLNDDLVDPWTIKPGFGSGNDDNIYQAFWQAMIKPYAYNPIAYVHPHYKKYFKVLKTFTKTIQSGTTTENDVDPQVHTLKWFMRWDRVIDYSYNTAELGDVNDILNQADFISEQARYCRETTYTKNKLFLLVRCQSPYQSETETNVDQPSFDLMVRACHQSQ